MLSLNQVTLAGNLTRDPEIRVVGAERSVATFAIAVNRRYKGPDGELKEETTFVDCEAWGRTAEIIGQYLVKGSPVYLEGRLRLDAWQDKDGQKRQRLKVVADNVQFLGRRPGEEGAPVQNRDTQAAPHPERPLRPTRPSPSLPVSATALDDQPPF